MKRAKTTKNLFDIKHSVFDLTGVWLKAIGRPDTHGAWLIWGREKNGKTWFAVLLAKMLSLFKQVHYISAEEGMGSDFVGVLKRAKVTVDHKIKWMDYEPLKDLYTRLGKRNAPKVVIIDNVTVYLKELQRGRFEQMLKDFPDVLFIFLAHEEDGKLFTSMARLVKKLSKRIFYVEGLTVRLDGRVDGGYLTIDEDKAAIIWGQDILNQTA